MVGWIPIPSYYPSPSPRLIKLPKVDDFIGAHSNQSDQSAGTEVRGSLVDRQAILTDRHNGPGRLPSCPHDGKMNCTHIALEILMMSGQTCFDKTVIDHLGSTYGHSRDLFRKVSLLGTSCTYLRCLDSSFQFSRSIHKSAASTQSQATDLALCF